MKSFSAVPVSVSSPSVPVTLSAHTFATGEGSDNIPLNSEIAVVDSIAVIIAIPIIVNIKISFDILIIEKKTTYYIALQKYTNLIN
jgi:hypothetical protein